MCYHRRTVYSCRHNGWARRVRTCNLQKAFLDGTFSKECEIMNAHPLHSVNVTIVCEVCAKKQKKTAATLSKIRAELKTLNEKVEKVAKAQKEKASSEDGSQVSGYSPWEGINDGESQPATEALNGKRSSEGGSQASEHASWVGIDDGEFEFISLNAAAMNDA